MTSEQQDQLDALREQLKPRATAKGFTLCTSRFHLTIATRRVFWPVLPDEDFPCYCDDCARMAKLTLETLGHKYRDELLPMPPGAADVSRGIDLTE